MPHNPNRTTTPGNRPAGWINGPRGSRSPAAFVRVGADSGTKRDKIAAMPATAIAVSQTATYDPAEKRGSAIGGPMASPRYSDSERKLIASPRRASGAMSAAAASAATKKN